MVSSPVMFDRQALDARPAPALGAHNTEVLTGLGYDEDAIIGLQVSGAVF
jgi:crotonobetainyl-CoA:carnitine CoA-transferase CaiB-like acyl-CoA transferase